MYSAVHQVLCQINDPEMPISIVDLGIVDEICIDAGGVTINILPTFVGCPALDMLKDEIVAKTSTIAGVRFVKVIFRFHPPWTPDRISPQGREHLRQFGVTVPCDHTGPTRHGESSLCSTRPGSQRVQLGVPHRPACPFCGEDC